MLESGAVDDVAVLQGWLASLSDAELGAQLKRRPDVAAGVPPRDLQELALRLWHPHSLVAALRQSSLSCLQLVETAQALSTACTRTALAELLIGDAPEHRRAVDRVVDELVANAVMAADGPERLVLPEALGQSSSVASRSIAAANCAACPATPRTCRQRRGSAAARCSLASLAAAITMLAAAFTAAAVPAGAPGSPGRARRGAGRR